MVQSKYQVRASKKYSLNCSSGFAYLALLVILALLAIGASASLKVTSLMQKRIAEEELLSIGLEFKTAFISYANATPPGGKRAPASLQELLRDTRSPVIRRHLRQIYIDPMTRLDTWGTVNSPDRTGIAGVFSLSEEKPIKIANFPESLRQFNNATSYRDWVF